jgi:hypothetical protein
LKNNPRARENAKQFVSEDNFIAGPDKYCPYARKTCHAFEHSLQFLAITGRFQNVKINITCLFLSIFEL